jgi:hypothetical protein
MRDGWSYSTGAEAGTSPDASISDVVFPMHRAFKDIAFPRDIDDFFYSQQRRWRGRPFVVMEAADDRE